MEFTDKERKKKAIQNRLDEGRLWDWVTGRRNRMKVALRLLDGANEQDIMREFNQGSWTCDMGDSVYEACQVYHNQMSIEEYIDLYNLEEYE